MCGQTVVDCHGMAMCFPPGAPPPRVAFLLKFKAYVLFMFKPNITLKMSPKMTKLRSEKITKPEGSTNPDRDGWKCYDVLCYTILCSAMLML